MTARVLTLLTDFGVQDGYVGAMKGVLLARAPHATLIDLSHAVPPGDVDTASFVLAQAAPWFPPGTLHLAVVDPGVGSSRRALAARVGEHVYVAPDNGLLSGVCARAAVERVHVIDRPAFAPASVSPVFHGRDLFAPAAAHLAVGGDWADLGPPLDPADLVVRRVPEPVRSGDEVLATVVHVDRFGNLITNLSLEEGDRGGCAEVGSHRLALCATYSDVAPGELIAVRGSSGFLEIARNGASAAEHLGMGRGDVVKWRALERR